MSQTERWALRFIALGCSIKFLVLLTNGTSGEVAPLYWMVGFVAYCVGSEK